LRSGARVVTIAGLLCSLAFVAVLHVVRADLPPVSHRLSEYANGPYGWMMSAAFFALGSGLIALGVALGAESRPRGIAWIMSATAVLAGAGALVSGAFRTGVSHASEVIHSRASALATVAIVALALAYSKAAVGHRPRGAHDPAGAVLALIAAALAALSPLLHDTRWSGLGQRLLWIALLTWLLRAAWQLPRGGMTKLLMSSGRPPPEPR
jgi:hypothetical protein